jgi:hypothetical protein
MFKVSALVINTKLHWLQLLVEDFCIVFSRNFFEYLGNLTSLVFNVLMVIKFLFDPVEKPKSDGAKSGDYGGWRIIVMTAFLRCSVTILVT